jgi:gliding motility-associated-like protein
MLRLFLIKTILILLFTLQANFIFSQPHYDFKLSKTPDLCEKATADLEITGTDPADTINIKWSNGATNTTKVSELNNGDYSVNIKIKHRKDSLVFIKDTTFYFTIDKELCAVIVDKYFSPNDDNYHDRLGIVNVEYYPNFEISIFNKWGQQIHSQKKTYTPWDGKWNGIDLPDGTYYYIFFYDYSQRNNLTKGDITILR